MSKLSRRLYMRTAAAAHKPERVAATPRARPSSLVPPRQGRGLRACCQYAPYQGCPPFMARAAWPAGGWLPARVGGQRIGRYSRTQRFEHPSTARHAGAARHDRGRPRRGLQRGWRLSHRGLVLRRVPMPGARRGREPTEMHGSHGAMLGRAVPRSACRVPGGSLSAAERQRHVNALQPAFRPRTASARTANGTAHGARADLPDQPCQPCQRGQRGRRGHAGRPDQPGRAPVRSPRRLAAACAHAHADRVKAHARELRRLSLALAPALRLHFRPQPRLRPWPWPWPRGCERRGSLRLCRPGSTGKRRQSRSTLRTRRPRAAAVRAGA